MFRFRESVVVVWEFSKFHCLFLLRFDKLLLIRNIYVCSFDEIMITVSSKNKELTHELRKTKIIPFSFLQKFNPIIPFDFCV